MDDIQPTTFQIFAEWLLHGKNALVNGPPMENIHGNSHTMLLNCYALGDRLICREFKNLVLDLAMIRYSADFVPGPNIVTAVYNRTPEGSPMRKLFVDVRAYHALPDLYDANWPDDHVKAVAKKLTHIRDHGKEDGPSTANLCKHFHEHKESEATCPEIVEIEHNDWIWT